MHSSKHGFTLIELLVVIAIIAILAAMLFPVFARARESARKIQCLANVKNIAIAVQMYLTDYDRLPPAEHRQEVISYFEGHPGGATNCSNPGPVNYAWRANPYLRWPVVFDEYIKNRDVWQCPSAKLTSGATFILPGPDFLGYLKQTQGRWGGSGFGPCTQSWPPGWGGAVTDSIAQQLLATANTQWAAGASQSKGEQGEPFVQGISFNGEAKDVKTSAMDDPASFVVCQDAGGMPDAASFGMAAYPDICCAECSGITYYMWGGWPPFEDCGIGSSKCGDCWRMHANLNFQRDPKLMEGATRHLGGSNLGFADGHASWIKAGTILSMAGEGKLTGIISYCPSGSRKLFQQNCGDPTGYNFLF